MVAQQSITHLLKVIKERKKKWIQVYMQNRALGLKWLFLNACFAG
jgi:hypothetical protein